MLLGIIIILMLEVSVDNLLQWLLPVVTAQITDSQFIEGRFALIRLSARLNKCMIYFCIIY